MIERAAEAYAQLPRHHPFATTMIRRLDLTPIAVALSAMSALALPACIQRPNDTAQALCSYWERTASHLSPSEAADGIAERDTGAGSSQVEVAARDLVASLRDLHVPESSAKGLTSDEQATARTAQRAVASFEEACGRSLSDTRTGRTTSIDTEELRIAMNDALVNTTEDAQFSEVGVAWTETGPEVWAGIYHAQSVDALRFCELFAALVDARTPESLTVRILLDGDEIGRREALGRCTSLGD